MDSEFEKREFVSIEEANKEIYSLEQQVIDAKKDAQILQAILELAPDDGIIGIDPDLCLYSGRTKSHTNINHQHPSIVSKEKIENYINVAIHMIERWKHFKCKWEHIKKRAELFLYAR